MAAPEMVETGYRPRRSYLTIGVTSIICFSIMGVVSAVVAYFNIDGSFRYPKPTALGLGTFWSAMTLLGVWMVLAYFRAYLVLDNAKIIQHGIIRSKVLESDGVTRIKWRRVPHGGSVVIRGFTSILKINFDSFVPRKRDELISILHSSFALDIQEGWSDFQEARAAVERRRGQKSASAAVVCILLLFGFAALSVYCWMQGMGTTCLVIGVVGVLAGLSYSWRLPVYWKRQCVRRSAEQSREPERRSLADS